MSPAICPLYCRDKRWLTRLGAPRWEIFSVLKMLQRQRQRIKVVRFRQRYYWVKILSRFCLELLEWGGSQAGGLFMVTNTDRFNRRVKYASL